jgi:redox-sensitive bicupin YhaK (pirin superfamily)
LLTTRPSVLILCFDHGAELIGHAKEKQMLKKILGVYSAPRPHWVGDGFPVRSLFSYDSHGTQLSPFLLLDHAGPARFDPAAQPRGVGEHPHRGFETVTIVYEGEVEHRDSTGAGGRVGPGDVQWMTAASGILHEEFHSEGFTRSGGTMEMMQLWVNLPARDKMSAPGYQTLLDAEIPAVDIADDAGRVRVIAGSFGGQRGPARTFTPIDVWDLRLRAGRTATLAMPDGHTVALVPMHGRISVNGGREAGPAQLVQFERSGSEFTVTAQGEATVLALGGQPLNEPVVGYGPFVMTSEGEIAAAIRDFQGGRFGRL